MFGMSFMEIFVIAVIAVLFLGPDKLPSTLVQIAKFFKGLKSSINDAKATFEQEIKIEELKEESKKYKEEFQKEVDGVRKKLTFEELDELKKSKQEISENVESLKEEMKLDNSKKVKKKEEDA